MSTHVKFEWDEVKDWTASKTRTKRLSDVSNHIGIDGEHILQSKVDEPQAGEIGPLDSTGKLYNSIQYDLKANQTSPRVNIKAQAPYSMRALETGSPPESAGGPTLSGKQLERWAVSKGKPKSFGHAVAEKINKIGTRKYRNGGPKHVTNAVNEISKMIDKKYLKKIADIFSK